MNDADSQGQNPAGTRPTSGQSAQDQGSGQAGSSNPRPDDPVVEIDGERMPVSEVKASIMRQKDYTQKTQELAEERKRLEEERKAFQESQQPKPPSDPKEDELRQGVDAIKQVGNLATVDEVEEKLTAFQAAQADERELNKTLETDERLKQNEDLLRDLGKANPDMAWADIVEKYKNTLVGVNPKEEAAVNEEIVGNPNYVKPQKPVAEMTEQEWEEYKAGRGKAGQPFDGKFVRQQKPSAHPNI